MPTWNELYELGQCVARFPEREVGRFVVLAERSFDERPLRLWDLCCGAGRHTEVLAALGHRVFASDNAPKGVALTRSALDRRGLSAEIAVADMTVCPWPRERFHGVLSWDALHHNTAARIRETVATVRANLVTGGLFLCTLKSRNADSFGAGDEIEPNTFVQHTGPEAGVPHHYFDEDEVRDMLEGWETVVLVERRCDYRVRSADFLDVNPFDYTVWGLLARKPSR